MTLDVVTHLNFNGNAREALEYYHSVFGGDLNLGTYGQGGVPHDSADSDQAGFDPVPADSPDADHVSFGMVAAENGFRIAAYDVYGADGSGLATADGTVSRSEGLTHTQPFFVVLNAETTDELRPIYDRLGGDGTVIQNLAPSEWAPAYGMVTDRFGVTWILGAAA